MRKEFGDGVAESGFVLSCDVNWDIESGACLEEFLGR